MKLRLPFVVLVLALAPLVAPLLAATHPLIALLIRSFFSRLCHQDPARSFVIGGSPVAVCVRCLGIYCGVALGMLLRMEKVSAFRLLAVAMLLNLLDVGSGILHWHGNMPVTRFWLGLLLGVATGSIFFLAPSDSLAPKFICRAFSLVKNPRSRTEVRGYTNTNRPGRPPGLR